MSLSFQFIYIGMDKVNKGQMTLFKNVNQQSAAAKKFVNMLTAIIF